ncbi:MAG: hypothetical protein QM697_15350 [Lachnospiraceae bacterium]
MEDYSNDFSKFVQEAVGKAKEFGGIAKLHAQIKSEEAKKQEQYYRLGKKYYELYKDTPEMELIEFVDKLAACDEKIKEYKKELKREQETGYRDVYRKSGGEEQKSEAKSTETTESETGIYREVEVVTDIEKSDR